MSSSGTLERIVQALEKASRDEPLSESEIRELQAFRSALPSPEDENELDCLPGI